MKRYILDTNLLIRFFQNDHPTMSAAATGLFLQSASGKVELYLDPAIVAETAFVLTSFYKKSQGGWRTPFVISSPVVVSRSPWKKSRWTPWSGSNPSQLISRTHWWLPSRPTKVSLSPRLTGTSTGSRT